MPKFGDYPAKTAPSAGDLIVIKDATDSATKRMTRANLLAGSPLPADTVDTQAIENGAVTPAKMMLGIVSATNNTSGTTTSTTNTATLTGGGTSPSITLTVPSSGSVMLGLACRVSNSVANIRCSTAVVMSGSNTGEPMSGAASLMNRPSTTNEETASATFHLTGLNPGSTTFQMQYQVQANTGTWHRRHMWAMPVA